MCLALKLCTAHNSHLTRILSPILLRRVCLVCILWHNMAQKQRISPFWSSRSFCLLILWESFILQLVVFWAPQNHLHAPSKRIFLHSAPAACCYAPAPTPNSSYQKHSLASLGCASTARTGGGSWCTIVWDNNVGQQSCGPVSGCGECTTPPTAQQFVCGSPTPKYVRHTFVCVTLACEMRVLSTNVRCRRQQPAHLY